MTLKTLKWMGFLGLACLVLTTALTFSQTAEAILFKSKKETQPSVTFSGFEPGLQIRYKILSASETLTAGEQTVDQNGTVNFEHPVGDNPAIAYDFQILSDKSDTPLNLLLRVNPATQTLTASGDGLPEFSPITLSHEKQSIETASDWAGLFEQQITPRDLKRSKNREVKIALLGAADIMMSAQSNQPRAAIIKVLQAPGGGGAGSGGVNDYTPSPSPLSTSDTAHVDQTIELIKKNYITALMLMTEQLSAVSMQQLWGIGTLLDGKQQLEAQRLHQQLKARAVKDYHPSEEMCRVGSFMRSIAHTEQKGAADKRYIAERLINNITNERGSIASEAASSYVTGRLKQYREVYCDPNDNNDGLAFMCEHDQDANPSNGPIGATDNLRVNKDIDYQRTLDYAKTLEIDFSDAALNDHEEDILALASNLYWPNALEWPADAEDMSEKEVYMMNAKRLMALNSVAHNSFTTLAGLKSQAPEPASGVEPGWAYMKTFIKEFGISDEDEIEEWLGVRPSYWTQMDILTKKMVQHPNFYTNLYDKPVNVDRMSVVLDAIQLMQMRDHYDSSLRAEMIKAAMIETELEKHFDRSKALLMTSE